MLLLPLHNRFPYRFPDFLKSSTEDYGEIEKNTMVSLPVRDLTMCAFYLELLCILQMYCFSYSLIQESANLSKMFNYFSSSCNSWHTIETVDADLLQPTFSASIFTILFHMAEYAFNPVQPVFL